MKPEPMPNPYTTPTIPPEPLTAADYALAIDLACHWLQHPGLERDTGPARAAYEGKYRDVQRLRLRLMHHEVHAERQAGRVPA